ncbi:MAG TPA: penicillin-binding protein 2 [Rubrobacteraceae bacterium]|nr:penicillin-binding protein 2 [Rubrobacteraceae bacterium]
MQMRVVSLAVLVAIVFIVLAARLWHLQVLTSEDYALSAEATQTREVKDPAQRGVVYDRNGEVLANNVSGLNVTVIPSAIGRGKVEELSNILGADTETVLERYDFALQTTPYASMLVQENADKNAVTYISERTEEFPGVTINDDWVRNYPNGQLAAHVLGYTGAVTEDELGQEPFVGLANDAVVGKSGVELAYEKMLRGKAGKKEYSVDALGRVVTLRRADGTRADGRPEVAPELGRPDKIVDPVPGKDLALTLDLELQKVVEKELDAAMERAKTEEGAAGDGGAVIAMDPRNGEILAMASRPTFEPQLFVGGVTGAEEAELYEYLVSDEANSPFANRAIYGVYPGASTFKVFTGMAGLAYGVINPYTTYTDDGSCWLPAGVVSGCWQSWRENYGPQYGTHGTQNYYEAIMDSNNKYFFQVVDWLWNSTDDKDLLSKFYMQFGFGSETGVDLPSEQAGLVPTQSWQEEVGATPDDRYWGVGRWVNMAIGQGDLQVTPLQLTRGYAAIQNGGTLVTPHVGLEVRGQNGEVEEKISPEPAGNVGVDQGVLDATIEGMRRVTKEGGTAEWSFKDPGLAFVGKSGTGEMWGSSDPVNWFAGWAENEENPIVVVAMVENGGWHSDVTAAPVVRHVLEAYYGVEQSPEDQWRTEPVEQPEPAQPPAPAAPAAPTAPAGGVPAAGQPATVAPAYPQAPVAAPAAGYSPPLG